MASVAHLIDDAYNIFVEIKSLEDEAEGFRYDEYVAARTIQRWVRGFLVRRYIAFLHSQATIIQKHWRGYLGRKLYLQVLKQRVDELCWNYYNLMAARIQKVWKGYYVRTRVFNYYEFKSWRNTILSKNDEMRLQMQDFHEALVVYELEYRERKAFHKYLFHLYRNHHFLRTYQIPGIYSKQNSKELSVLEQRMKALKFKNYMIKCHRERREKEHIVPSTKLIFKDRLQRCERFWRDHIQLHGKYLSGAEEYIDPVEREKEMKREKEFGLARMKFSLSHPKADISKLPFEKSSKVVWRESDPSKNISEVPFVTQIQRIKSFDDLLKCEFIHVLPTSPKMEFYTKVPQCTCYKLNKK